MISSTAAREQNQFVTRHVAASGEENSSVWQVVSTGGQGGLGGNMLSSAVGAAGTVGKDMAANSLGMLGGGRDHNEHSESQSAISGNITVQAQSQSGHYLTDVSQADKALENRFDAQKLSNQLEASRVGTQLVGKVVGEVADELGKRHVWGFGDGGYLRTALETGGNAGIAALTGGNVGVAAASTLAGNIAAYRTRQWASNLAAGMTKDPGLQDLYKNAISNVIASGAGAAGGLVAGGGENSTNALNGAAAASAIQQYNQAAEQREDMKQREKDILESDPEVKKLLMSSPTAKKEIEDLEGQGWKIVSSNNGGGYTDYADKRIFISPNVSSTTAVTVSAISHELGHALHPTDYDASSKETYISKTLDGEGWATINNIIVANEINKSINDPYNRIDVQGASSYQYVKIYSKYGTNYEGAHEIGKWYADHETTSVNNATYRDYYGASYDHVDIQKEHEINYPKNKQ